MRRGESKGHPRDSLTNPSAARRSCLRPGEDPWLCAPGSSQDCLCRGPGQATPPLHTYAPPEEVGMSATAACPWVLDEPILCFPGSTALRTTSSLVITHSSTKSRAFEAYSERYDNRYRPPLRRLLATLSRVPLRIPRALAPMSSAFASSRRSRCTTVRSSARKKGRQNDFCIRFLQP